MTIHPGKLFERFQKADPSSPSAGLGLSIAAQTCRLYGWQIIYEQRDDQHIIKVVF